MSAASNTLVGIGQDLRAGFLVIFVGLAMPAPAPLSTKTWWP